ncbi:universal stress protein [Halobacillus sp. A1]|uniref:universal stress protein n=1 Tax=Halobacillus sp. A1 TaxID=2880262 RepID=UPI0020A6BCC4|nr:universal stress protein [Halobacillus sp. A1]MCP3030025.1 universal stress protein [Halobacillus sp. A1]
MKENILVAYDGSELSKKAVREALTKESANSESRVHVISVIKPTGPFTNQKISESIGTELAENYRSELAAIKEEFKTVHQPIITDVLVSNREGNLGHKICEYAEQHDIDLIIVGNRGLGNVKKFFLGSVSNNVAQHAKCPVLIVK